VSFNYPHEVSEPLANEQIRAIIGTELTEDATEALARWYAAFARDVAKYPAADLKCVEPPLRSTPGPMPK
jgi:hypothetical protein